MLKSYLTTAVRNLRTYPAYSAINIVGLALSISVCLLLILLVQDQRRYDCFHEKADRIYRVTAEANGRRGQYGLAATPAYLGGAMEREMPDVERSLRIGRIEANLVHSGHSFPATGLYVDPSFFDLFDFKLVAGEAQDALGQPNRLILSETTAARIFGTNDPMGEAISLEGVGDLVVAGVVRTVGRKSHLKFDLLTSFSTLEAVEGGRERLQNEGDFWSFANYVLLKKGASAGPLEVYLAGVSERYCETNEAYALKLQPLTGITLGPLLNNEISAYSMPLAVVLMLAGLAGVVLLASGFNYVSLTIARSVTRAKEVGIRKTVGARREQVVAQFLAESVFMAMCALVLAHALLDRLLPIFNGLSIVQQFEINLSPEQVFDVHFVGLFLAFSIGVGLLAGAYPALYLSRVRPALILKGNGLGSGTSRMRLRKGLTLFQLVFSLLFIITTALIYRQLTFMANFDFGFQTEDVVNIELQGVSYTTLKNELMRQPGVLTVGAADILPANGTRNGARISANQQDTIRVYRYDVDSAFLDALDIRLVAGHSFSPTYAGRSEGVLINETAARQLGFENPRDAVDQVLFASTHAEPISVLGVVQDYQFLIVVRPIEPTLFLHDPAGFAYATVRLQPGAMDAFLTHLADVWKRLDSVHPVEYKRYNTQLRDNELTRIFRDLVQISGLVALIAVTIACLGLMSMAAFNTQLRTKEIGVRKVLGADMRGLFWLLSREYVYLAGAAIAIATPAAWFLNNLWLEQIANRVTFGPALIGLSTATLLALAMLAVGSQTLRATRANPVDSLRWE
jgi:putative ABC transport system permease protein